MSDFAYPLHEECGVFGIYERAGTEDVDAAAYGQYLTELPEKKQSRKKNPAVFFQLWTV